MTQPQTRTADSTGPMAWIYDSRLRAIVAQTVVVGAIAWVLWYLADNTQENMAKRGMSTGFDFVFGTAGFDISWSLFEVKAGSTYLTVFKVGIVNTLVVSVLSIVCATLLGFFVGLMRLSSNWLVARIAAWYIEILRNTPLLLQILFWFIGVFTGLPPPRQSYQPIEGFVLNNRGFFLPSPVPEDGLWMTGVAVLVAVVAAVLLHRWARARQAATGERFPSVLAGIGIAFALPAGVFLATGSPLDWNVPKLRGFNFVGGMMVPPAFCALLIALSVYTSCFIAEMVRAGIQSVSHGQTEAAYALGVKPTWTMRLIVIPQAMRAIIPPLISSYLNVTKNSSLAVAIGYPDLVAVWMQTSLNQSGRAIEIVATTMLFYMTCSLFISILLNVYNRRMQLRER
ncbi:MAG: amino acid ABC transporter permease [Rhodospirillales bacterium]